MTWLDEVDIAMRRGNSPYGAMDLFGWLRQGTAGFAVCDGMHASWVYRQPDLCEVGHVYGRWDNLSLLWLLGKMKLDMARRGVPGWTYDGRGGWGRFLAMKGLEP